MKYNTKGTQDDDTKDFNKTSDTVRRVQAEPKHENDRRESMRLHLSTSYTYNDSCVTGPPMASYLTRHGSKFWFSHDFVWCPVKDLINCLDDVKIDYSVRKIGQINDNHGKQSS